MWDAKRGFVGFFASLLGGERESPTVSVYRTDPHAAAIYRHAERRCHAKIVAFLNLPRHSSAAVSERVEVRQIVFDEARVEPEPVER